MALKGILDVGGRNIIISEQFAKLDTDNAIQLVTHFKIEEIGKLKAVKTVSKDMLILLHKGNDLILETRNPEDLNGIDNSDDDIQCYLFATFKKESNYKLDIDPKTLRWDKSTVSLNDYNFELGENGQKLHSILFNNDGDVILEQYGEHYFDPKYLTHLDGTLHIYHEPVSI